MKTFKRLILFFVIFVSAFFFASCEKKEISGIEVHFLNIGHAEASIIKTENQTILIDCGNSVSGESVSDCLNKLSVENIDILVVTHFHEDHMGGILDLMNEFNVEEIMMPPGSENYEYYNNIKTKIDQSGTDIISINDRDEISVEKLKLKFYIPFSYEGNNVLNDASAVVKLEYDNFSVLFASDIQKAGESALLNSGLNLKADVIKVPHHGSKTSSGYDFIKEVTPKYAVILCGSNNYGHPSESVITKYAATGCEVFRTDICGDVVLKSDGENITVENQRNISGIILENSPCEYVGNLISKKFHQLNCELIPEVQNSVLLDNSAVAKSEGYVPCGLCIN